MTGRIAAVGALLLTLASNPLGTVSLPRHGSGALITVARGGDLTAYAHPLAGSLGPGFPLVGAGLPFGMASPGPATALPGGDDPVNYVGYSYQDPMIRGFALTHFDGAGIHIGGDLPIMATTGSVQSDPVQFASPFSHASEVARPGYYGVTLARYGIGAELTATTRVGLERFSYPPGHQDNVLLDVARDNAGIQQAVVHVDGDRELSGWVHSTAGAYTLFFTARFDQPFSGHGTAGPLSWASYPASATARTVTVRIGLSYTDAAAATLNLDQEAPPGRSFEAIAAAAHATWNAHLQDVVVSGGTRAKTVTFYTNLYRSMLEPTTFDDVDGRYLGFDGHVHALAAGHHHYTGLSLWDTYRTQTPLLDLVEPAVGHDIAVSLLDDADQNHGVIPRWVYANADYGIMGGDSATPSLASDVVDGVLSGTDAARAYAAVLRQATTLPPVFSREHLDAYLAKGFIGNDVTAIGASETLEYALDDAAVADLARRFGTPGEVAAFTARGAYWRNLMDPSGHFLRPRLSSGAWANPTSAGPVAVWSPLFQDGWQEGTGWQYLWSVPQDVIGLADAMGGKAASLRRLDHFFTAALDSPVVPAVPKTQEYASLFGVYYVGDQYTPANEPDLWAGWFYDWLGQPWKTDRVVRAMLSTYSGDPSGLPGNDDAGTMSAWYVLAALGIYQVTPGVATWELSGPTFPVETLRVHSGHTFSVTAPGTSAVRQYVTGANLDGHSLERPWLRQADIVDGGRLRVDMAAMPNRSWGSDPSAAPPSLTPGPLQP